jgi:hypothetical protein
LGLKRLLPNGIENVDTRFEEHFRQQISEANVAMIQQDVEKCVAVDDLGFFSLIQNHNVWCEDK